MSIPDYIQQLNPAQREAVLYEGSSLLILAGAGSGKTRVITTRIAYLIDKLGVDPSSILAVTFTNKAAAEMKERVSTLVPAGSDVMIRTFHSFGAWLLRRNSHLLSLSSRFSIYDDDDSVTLLNSLTEGKKKRELNQFSRWISRAKDYCLAPEDNLDDISEDQEFPELYRKYEDRLREMGNTDFGDLILRPVELLKENPEVRNRFHQRFKVVLVDEYQDSNVAQYELLKLLAGEGVSVCVVGDDDQSIYKFRGAEVRNIINFPDHFPGTKTIRLEQNYRSTDKILAIASSVVENNSERLGKTLWTDKAGGSKAVLSYLNTQEEEAEYCAALLGDGNLRGTAILYRTNAQSVTFETCFARKGIPYQIVGSKRFYDREEIKDILAYLALLNNPADEIAFRRVINKPRRGLGKSAIENILNHIPPGSQDMWAACHAAKDSMTARAGKGLDEFLGMKTMMDESLEKVPLPEFLDKVIQESGLLDVYAEKDEITAAQKSQNLDQVINASGNYAAGREGLTAFLEDMELDRSLTEEGGDNREGVTLITMHNTKGLEFDRVIITGMDEGLFPGYREESAEALEEERRIFYVSLTRAKRELYLTTCKRRLIWGRWQSFMPSLFIQEIPEKFLDIQGQSVAVYNYGGATDSDREWEEDNDFIDDSEAGSPGEVGGGHRKKSGESEWPVGTGVYHEDYGSGLVCKEWSNGQDLLILVRFESGRTAQFIPKYTPLERIAHDYF
ncbi:MAG: UvrD-helicase domain-containing protein [Spirochaetales bacterium]|nr:UvrD-helicase domain-containing protein [Spirochaetales bacterium]